MSIGSIITKLRRPTTQSRVSPVTVSACLVTTGLLVVGIIASIATHFVLASLPNIIMLIIGILILDVVLIHFAPKIHLTEATQSVLYGVLYLFITAVCAVLAAYSLQRFAFPLRDHMLESIDMAMGLKWLDYAQWVDKHPIVQTIFHDAYYSIWPQTMLPVIVLTFAHRPDEARAYLLTFSIALSTTLCISALLPAVGQIVFFDRSIFDVLRFTGATPMDQLMHLREAGPLIQNEFPGGIATFPSFHATMAVLTPLALRSFPRLFAVLLLLNAAMLGSTITEGAHYFIDILAGILMAFFAYAVAKRVIGLEDHLLKRRRNSTSRPRYLPA